MLIKIVKNLVTIHLMFLMVLVSCLIANGQGWEMHYDQGIMPFNSQLIKVITTADGGFAAIGNVGPGQSTDSSYLFRTDRNGQLIGLTFYGSTDTAIVNDIKATPDGGFILVGHQYELSTGMDIFLLKLDANGNIEWKFVNTRIEDNRSNSIDITPDGGYIIGGRIDSDHMYVLKMSENGIVEWDNEFGQMGSWYANDVLANPDGSIVLVGSYRAINLPNSALMYKLDSSGNLLWDHFYQDSIHNFFNTVTSCPGGYIAAGTLGINSGNEEVLLQKITDLGIVDWTRRFPVLDFSSTADMSSTPDGGFVIAGSGWNILGPVGIEMKVDSAGNLLWDHRFGTGVLTSGVTIADDGGYVFSGGWAFPYLLKLGANGFIHSSFLTGTVVSDQNLNCTLDTGEFEIKNWMVEAKGDKTFYALTDSLGEYLMNVDSGSYDLMVIPPSQVWQPCQAVQQVYVDTFSTTITDFPITAIDSCAYMTVDISTPFLRRCFDNNYAVNYCNFGTITATNAYIEIEFDPFLKVNSSTIPWSAQIGNTFVFPIGDVGINDCGNFFVNVTVDCDSTVLGQTHCVEAHIYPDDTCIPPQPFWDGSITKLDVQCGIDSLTFTIKNIGAGDMNPPLNYFVVEDNIIMRIDQFQLVASDSLLLKFPSNGSTYRLYAEQAQGLFPPNYLPTIAIEGCGVDPNTGLFSLGFITTMAEDDVLNYVSIDCQENIGSYDPNDKKAEPKGAGLEHYIKVGDDLEYLIRFQNTGTDTAFTVKIRDTLSGHLDITSLHLGASSHPYSLIILEENILQFTFNNILLVDSTTNEPASHGFVKFKVSQQPNLPLETVIYNSAGIYFDFNDPIITNQTFHRIGQDFIAVLPFTEELPEYPDLSILVQPNPFVETAEFVLENVPDGKKTFQLFDSSGKQIRDETFNDNTRFLFSRNGLPDGIYFYTIQWKSGLIASGKLIAH